MRANNNSYECNDPISTWTPVLMIVFFILGILFFKKISIKKEGLVRLDCLKNDIGNNKIIGEEFCKENELN
jgi:hypothetical protein